MSAYDKVTDRVIRLADGAVGLPGGMEGGRYLCRSCGEALVLKGTKPDAQVALHFSHTSAAGCADPGREIQIEEEQGVASVARYAGGLRPPVTAEGSTVHWLCRWELAPLVCQF